MFIGDILYHPHFARDIEKLTSHELRQALKIENLFKSNPLHPSLRLHGLKGRLKGYYSISVTLQIRIIFKRNNDGQIVFLSIGRHDIYRTL